MRPPKLHRGRLALLAAVVAVVALVAGIGVSCCQADSQSSGAGDVIRIGTATVGSAVPSGFLGISMEFRGLEAYAGTNPQSIDAPFAQLLRNLAPGGRPVLRVGGDSTDWTWWPVPGMTVPGGVKFALTPTWMGVAKSLMTQVSGHLIVGLNFEADSRRIAAVEERAMLARIGQPLIRAFELGNEPELYASFPWYKTASGHHVYGRLTGYNLQSLIADFAGVAAGLPNAPLAGPSMGAPAWLSSIGQFAAHEPRVSLVTIHAYPLKHCVPTKFASASQLFQTVSLQGLANEIGGWTSQVGAHHLPVRVDEMNSVSCGGQRGLSQSFAPALWALDMLPRLVRSGTEGVNFHTVPNANNALISASQSHGQWRVSVQPEYYGLMTFAQAAPTGARLLHHTGPSIPGLDEWATRAPNGQIHVVLINTSGRALSTSVSVAGASGTPTLARLQAPGLGATSGVTFGGQSISPTTGQLAGGSPPPVLTARGGLYPVRLPGYSAAVLTFSPAGAATP